MKLLNILKPSAEYLEKEGIDDPLTDAEMIVFHAAGTDRLTAYRDNPEIGYRVASKINRLLERRSKGEPVQYIVGYINFLGLKIRIGIGVLIPRPETEILAQEAIKTLGSQPSALSSQKKSLAKPLNSELRSTPLYPHPPLSKGGMGGVNHSSLTILDLCTGSGCIPLAIAKKFPDAEIYGTDISATAVRYAKKNADLNSIKNVVFLKGSLFEPLEESLKFDLITSNPPYIKTSDLAGLQREIRDWEPVEALDGGKDGLDFFRRIFSEAGKYLKENGKLMLEIGFDQAEPVKEIAVKSGFKKITFIKDFAGIDRILKAEA